MNGVLKRRLLFVAGPFTGLVMFAAVVMIHVPDQPRVQGRLPPAW